VKPLRLAFAGTPEFAVRALDALAAAGHDIAAIFTQPDRPAGRGRGLAPTPVATRALALGVPTHKPARFDAGAIATLRALAPDALVVVAYGLILPADALAVPRLGAFNIHASLLPRWRGAAPIQRAILAGDDQTGITIMRMDAGLDTGPMVLAQAVPIGPDATSGELHDTLGALGARLMVDAFEQLAAGRLRETPQPAEGATYAKKISKDEARLDWSRPAAELARRVRAFHPAPVAWTELAGERVLRARVDPGPAREAPGTIVSADARGIGVATGGGTLLVDELQFAGGRPLSAAQAAAGHSLRGGRLA
jgi:methionyl-tRNA formyltransferase